MRRHSLAPVPDIAVLPNDLLHVIFSKLKFKDKVAAGLACKHWEQLLREGGAASKHWVVHYNVDCVVYSPAFNDACKGHVSARPCAVIGRWFARRAAAIKSVRLSATVPSDSLGGVVLKFLESQLPLLAGCLSKHVDRLELEFFEGSPLDSPVLAKPSFLSLLSPMVRSLRLCNIRATIPNSQFAAICELTNLEELHILGSGEEDQEGVRELTQDISKLVNLRVLHLSANDGVDHLPEAISCLQRLELLRVDMCPVSELPNGLTALANLSGLHITWNGPLGPAFPPGLQGLKSLSTVALSDCCLMIVPGQLSSLAALTSLDLCGNSFDQGTLWWPAALARLTQLEELILCDCTIVDVPPHFSTLSQLKKLDLSMNKLRSVPEHLSSLAALRTLLLHGNQLTSLPVKVLTGMTSLFSVDFSSQQSQFGMEAPVAFEIPTCMEPFLHQGLGRLDVRQSPPFDWDPISLFHLGRAMSETAGRSRVCCLYF